jgi:uncharacterized protein (TIGR02996 family)
VLRDELLRAIASTPEDFAPRLVYADWLEETGELARATRIRTECTLDGVPRFDARWRAHRAWERATGTATEDSFQWLLGSYLYELGPSRGGFIEGVGGVVSELRRLPEVAAAWPVRSLRLTDDSRMPPLHVPTVVACPTVAQLAGLQLESARLDAHAAAALGDSPQLAKLRRLALGYDSVTGDGLRVLLQTPLAARLTDLSVTGGMHHDHAWPLHQVLARAKLPALRRLRVSFERRASTWLGPLLERHDLEELDLFSVELDAAAWQALATSARLPAWLKLCKAGAPNADWLRAFADSRHRRRVRSLELTGTRIGVAGARALIAATWPALEQLELADTGIDARVATELAAAGARFPKLAS